MATLVRGDDLNFPAVLRKDGATFSIDTGAIVACNFIEKASGLKMLPTAIPVLLATSGSDWPNSKVIVAVDAETSALLTPGQAIMEIQVDDPVNTEGKKTWHKQVTIAADVIP